MNTPPKPKLTISAKYLGPIFSLEGELTKNAQNLIFARNGTGKSFLSRAFRYLDLQGQGKELSDAARNLVSDESIDGNGSFAFSRGSNTLGALQLDQSDGTATTQVSDTIFHVFSEDFVHEELREQQYNLNGEIESQIAVDSVNIKLTEAKKAFEEAQKDEQSAVALLSGKFDSERDVELIEKAGIRKQLNEYKALSFERLVAKIFEKPAPPKPSFTDLLKDLDSLKAIPSEPRYPQSVDSFQMVDTDLAAVAESLKRITSPSSVSAEIRRKIDAHHDFYEFGVAIVQNEHRDTCPFCEQGITGPNPQAVIDAYLGYFADEEEKHKTELRRFYAALNRHEQALGQAETRLIHQKSLYDDLKNYMPSKREAQLEDAEESIKHVREAIAAIKDEIEKKANALAVAHVFPERGLHSLISDLNGLIEKNNLMVVELNTAVQNSDDERKSLQRRGCAIFEQEFAIRNWPDIENLRLLREAVKAKEQELAALEKSSPSTDARSRVADTFELLLREFFADKYVFDKDTFALKRGDHEMRRGAHRTLSDGEKTAIAFCYFVACAHLKVGTNSDYRRLFLVFDDPVTSMSYDFVYSIAQTLKNLSISDRGEVSLKSGLIDGTKRVRPELLVLTHSSYFFNISVANKVVEPEAAFALHPENGSHILAPLKKYIAPFDQQLKDVFEISEGVRGPDHSTGNAIRCVLEAIGRFCRPDKSASLTDFIQHLSRADGIVIKSVLINSLSHGTYYDEIPAPDDLKLACTETLTVVEKYAAGHLEILKAS